MTLLTLIEPKSNTVFVILKLRYFYRLETKFTPYDILSIYLLIHEADLEAYIESLPDTIDCPLTWMVKDIQVCTLLDLESVPRDETDNQNESIVIEPYGSYNLQF